MVGKHIDLVKHQLLLLTLYTHNPHMFYDLAYVHVVIYKLLSMTDILILQLLGERVLSPLHPEIPCVILKVLKIL